MQCRHYQCPVIQWSIEGVTGWVHDCLTHVGHNHLAEPDKRINTQPIKGEK